MDTADIAGGNKSKSSSSSLRTIQSEDNIAYYINDKKSSKHKRHKRPSLLRRQSSLLLASIQSSLPTTPTAWALATLFTSSALLQYELRLQKSLSSPPDVFVNLVSNDKIRRLYDKLSQEGGIWKRSVVPSLFVGTRGVMSSVAAYALKGNEGDDAIKSQRVREVMTMGADGAKLVLDWEVPCNNSESNFASVHGARVDTISKPVVLLVHGMFMFLLYELFSLRP